MDEAVDGAAPTQRPGAAYATNNYGPVGVGLLAIILVGASSDTSGLSQMAVSVLSALVLFGSYRAAGTTPRNMRRLVVVVVVVVVVLVAASFSDDPQATGISLLVIAILLGGGPVVIVRSVFEAPVVRPQHILAAIEAYVQIALSFAFFFSAVAAFSTEQFFNEGPGTFFEFLYFSVVTITTLGYGDLTPGPDIARALVMIETILGQVFLVVLVARLVSSLGERRQPPIAAQSSESSDS